MKKNVKSLVAVLLIAACMTGVVSGCGQTAAPAASTAPTAAAPAASAGAPAAKAPEASKAPVKLDKITYLTKEYYDKPEFVPKLAELFKKDTGVTLDIISIPNTNWEEKVTSTFISGDMPDVARVGNNIYPMTLQGQLMPLNDVMKGNPTLTAVFDKNKEAYAPYQIDGKIYAISVNNPKYMNMWIREDWLEKAGLKMPTTMDEWVAALKKFRDGDFDGNGKQDTIPLTAPAVLKTQNVIAGYFGTRNNIFKKDEKFVEPFTTPEYKTYMEFMKMLYDEKLLDAEIPTNTSYGSVRTKFNNQNAASIIMWDDNYGSLKGGLTKAGFKDAKLNYVPAIAGDKGVMGYAYFEADSPIALTSGAKQPQAVYDTFFNWYFNSDNGIISTSRGVPEFSYTVDNGVIKPNADNGAVGFKGQSFPPIKKDFVYPFKFDEVNDAQYKKILEIGDYGQKNFDKVGLVSPAPEQVAYQSIMGDLDTKVNELYYQFILGKSSYDKFVSDYNAYRKEINMDKIMGELNK